MDNPGLRAMVFSKGSLDKQAELKDDYGAWIKWLREGIEEADRKSIELTNQEMQRIPETGDHKFDAKFEVRLRLHSWSHSIRAKELKKWNADIDKIQLAATNQRDELVVTLTIPKLVKTQDLWNRGWQNAYVFVTALNIGSFGFFWWYLPKFTSRYYDRMRDVEHGNDISIDRIPELKMTWGNLAFKDNDLNNVRIVYGFVAHANDVQFQALHRYFRTLGLMAKNDIFYQFEPNIVVEFTRALKDALEAYGDWDKGTETVLNACERIFRERPESEKVLAVLAEMLIVVDQISTQKPPPRPITLEDAMKAKVIFEVYVRLKAQQHFQEEVRKMKEEGIEPDS